MGQWKALIVIVVLGVAPLACATAVRTRVLGVIFDGVPESGGPVAAAPQRGRKPPPAEPSVQPAAIGAAATAPVIPPAPFEAHKTWGEVLKALPTDAGGGVDWVQAFQKGLVTPRFVPGSSAEIGRPLTLDTLMDVVVGDQRQPALDLDVRITPSANPSLGAGSLYDVTFPHSSHTALLGCSSCHPGVLAAKTGMLGILKGESCGRCHGRVAFAPEVSCGRCHTKLAPPAPEAVVAEISKAGGEPVAAGPEMLARGQTVYGQLCATCHGDAGDGKGTLSPQLDPKPRDFTAGKYKFRTTLPASIPTDLDMLTTITRGVPGTSMPAFLSLPREDRWALVHYVKTFSDKFVKAEAQPIPIAAAPTVTPELLAMGLDLYTQAGCNTCHGDTGRGDGPSAPTLKDDWGNSLRPFNFASGRPMKGGSGPDAVYRTVMTGLQGTPMPGFGDALSPEQGWALASYVLTLFDQDKQPFAVQGDIRFVRSGKTLEIPGAQDYPPVVFPHWFHRIRVKCASCHPRVFEMRAGANAVSMEAMRSGRFCATCHNGQAAWEVGFPTCVRCHVTPQAERVAGRPSSALPRFGGVR